MVKTCITEWRCAGRPSEDTRAGRVKDYVSSQRVTRGAAEGRGRVKTEWRRAGRASGEDVQNQVAMRGAAEW